MFERAAYGCKLFCCWCAQDIRANYFWESLGFVPLAFRTGASGKKGTRTHIFWQRRIREGDSTTPYWFPAKTDAGAMREDRLVLPIPPGVHWRDVMPIVLPQQKQEGTKALTHEGKGQTPVPRAVAPRRVQFGPPSAKVVVDEVVQVHSAKPKRKKVRADPAHVAAARELRDRWLERVNAEPSSLLSQPRYDVSRALPESGPATMAAKATPLLEAA